VTTISSAATVRSTWTRKAPRAAVVRALVRRDYRVSRSYRIAFALDALYGFVSLTIYYFISRTFDDVATANLAGAPSYFAFAAVGVALNLVIQSATARLGQRIREEQLTGALEILVAQPVTPAELASGLAGFHYCFAILRAVFYLLIAGYVFDADLSNADWGGFVAVIAATAPAMAAVGIALASVVLVLKRAELVTSLTLLALSLLGGAFFPTDVLPDWLEPVADVLPTTFAFSGVRNALYTGDDWAVPALELAAFAAVGLPIAVALFGRALRLAIDRGSLSTP
jgi:ABC-2 type transport system permease protein